MTAARAQWAFAFIVAVAATVAIISLTGCGSSDLGNAGAASDSERAALDLAQCVRDNGVTSFPDPIAKPDGSFGFERPQGVPQSALDDALEGCQPEARAAGFDPGAVAQDPKARDQLLAFSRCMRRNGVPDFPDPKPSGNGSLRSIFGKVDLQSPRVQKAMQSCDSNLSRLGGPLGGGSG